MMRKNQFFIAMAWLAFLPTNLFAQEVFYRQNIEKVQDVAEKEATNIAKNDEEKKAIYKDAIEKAFEKYWKVPEVQTGWETDSLANIANKVEALKEKKEVLEASLNSLRQNEDAAKNAENEKAAIQKRLEHYRTVAENQRKESADIASQLEKLNGNLDQVDAFNRNKKEREKAVKELAKQINDFCNNCQEKSLLDKDFLSEGNQLIRQYSGKDEKIIGNIAKINGYLALAKAVQDGDNQINEKFNDHADAIKQIDVAVDSLQGLNVSLSDKQKSEYQDRLNLLRNHGNVKENLTKFLDYIRKTNGEINNEAQKKETIGFIEKELKKDEWKKMVEDCQKYEKLKAALETFRILKGRIGSGDRAFISYVDNIKKDI